MGPKDFSQTWKWFTPGLCLLVILVLVALAPLPAAAQGAFMYVPMQKLGQATAATLENAASKIPTGNKAAAATSGANYRSQGQLLASTGTTPGQDRLIRERRPIRHYCYQFWAEGIPKGSDPTEAYWFETRNGKFMLVDPRLTQRYSHMPK